jgi:excisionase family DNA binding protein
MPSNVILMTSSEVARELCVSSTYIRKLANAGRLPASKTPLGRLYLSSDVQLLAAERSARQQRRDQNESEI